ncbi:carbonic anhydrase [Streptomyces sp. NPDC059271]|uniref:carbonic anhydrase n=1 Tax=Streptomyces sp. NPDC059271 TaxID=3346799 RepID=UPI00369563E2
MTDIDELVRRNADFVLDEFLTGLSLTINPTGNMMVIGCVDPRVDPGRVLGIKRGEAAMIRNVGGRITPATLRTMRMLSKVGAANPDGKASGPWNLVILHHTDCGMTDLAPHTDLLAEYFEIPEQELAGKSVSDPYGSVRVDVGIIQEEIRSPDFLVSGLVYDVESGLVEVVVPPTQVPTT